MCSIEFLESSMHEKKKKAKEFYNVFFIGLVSIGSKISNNLKELLSKQIPHIEELQQQF